MLSSALSITAWAGSTLPNSPKYYRALEPCPKGHYERYYARNRCVICARMLVIQQHAERAAERAKMRLRRGAPKKNFPDRPKACNCCRIVKPPSEFGIVRSSGMLVSDCRECRRFLRKGIPRAELLGKPLENVLGVSKQT